MLLACAPALLAVGCGGGEDDDTSTTTAASTTSTTQQTEAAPPTETEQEQASTKDDGVELYFTRGEQFRKVERDLPAGGSEDSLEQVSAALVAGPRDGDGAQTAIPEGVDVEDVSLDGDAATVELSPDFTDGIAPGARSDADQQELNARLGQLTYTLTQFDGVKTVKVLAGGEAVEPAIARAAYAKPAKGPVRKDRPKGKASAGTKAVQERLIRLHYLPKGSADGVAGYQTQQAVMAFQAWEGLTRDGVVGPQTKGALANARRPRPRAGGPPKRIEVYRDKGVALLIDHGNVKRAVHVSTGAPGTSTPAGTFQVFRKEERSWSVPFQVWLPWASYFTGGIAFHEYPDVPPFPASHGCVRVPAPEARMLYDFAAMGTTIAVF